MHPDNIAYVCTLRVYYTVHCYICVHISGKANVLVSVHLCLSGRCLSVYPDFFSNVNAIITDDGCHRFAEVETYSFSCGQLMHFVPYVRGPTHSLSHKAVAEAWDRVIGCVCDCVCVCFNV